MPPTLNHRLLLALLVGIQFCHAVDFMLIMPLGPRLMTLMSLTPAQFSFAVAAYTFAAGVSGIAAGLLIDRFDRRRALLWLFAGFILGTAWCAGAGTYTNLLIGRVMAGAFGGVLGSLALSIAADTTPPERRATAMGVIGAAFSVASVVGIPAGLWLSYHWDWHAPFWAVVGVSVVVWWGFFWGVPPLRDHLSRGLPPDGPLIIIGRLLASTTRLQGLLLVMLGTLGHFTVVPMLATFIVGNVGLGEGFLPIMYAVGGAVTIGTSPLIGRLADRYGHRLVLMALSPMAALVILGLTHLPPVPGAVALCFTVGYFVFSGGRFVPSNAIVAGLAPPEQRGSYMAFVSSAQQLMAGVASMAAGVLVSGRGVRLEGFGRVGVMAALCTAAATALVYHMERQSRRPTALA